MHRGLTDLPTAYPHPFPWAPAGESEWIRYAIVLDNEQYMTPYFRVQFEFESRLGNNIYLDDINVIGVGGTQNVGIATGALDDWTLAPNPSSGVSRLTYQARHAGMYSVTVQDASGHLVDTQNCRVEVGDGTIDLPRLNTKGIYLVTLEDPQGSKKTWRWIKQ